LLGDAKVSGPMSWLACEWTEYVRLFHGADRESAIGESSAAYLWSEGAPANIQAHVPNARIVIILRDPAERAFSHYLHQVSVGFTGATFREHVGRCLRSGSAELGVHYPFLEIGLYYEQVKRYLSMFPRDRVRIYWYEECWLHPHELMKDLFRFLDVDERFEPDLSYRSLERRAPRHAGLHYVLKRTSVWQPLRGMVPATAQPYLRRLAFREGNGIAMRAEDRQFLIDYYRSDIAQLSRLLDRDLSAWLR
jgi:hypothetical protein